MRSVQNSDSSPLLRIAVDLDGVLTDSLEPLAHAANSHFDIGLPETVFVDSSGMAVPDEVREWTYRPEGPAAALDAAHGAQAFMRQLMDIAGADNVLIVTARPESSADMTIRWFRQHGFEKVQLIFADDKVATARRQGCTWAVEDSIRHASTYADAGVNVFTMNVVEHLPDPLPATIHPVSGFSEIIDQLSRTYASRSARLIESLPPLPSADASGDRWKIVVSDKIHDIARTQLSEHADLVDVDGTDIPSLYAVLAAADALVIRSETNVTQELLEHAPRLRVVARAGVGVDNVDVPAATRAGVIVLNTPGANAISAGEHAIALLMAATRQIPFANATTHAGEWQRKAVRPIDLRGRTLGLVGLGRVGLVVARRLKAFEMHVIAFDPFLPSQRFHEMGIEAVDLDEIWSRSDVVSFHCPATPENHHILNEQTLAQMKPGAIVINAGRGELVDEYALAHALESGHIRAAGVDVYPHEPCVESPLFGIANAVLTPHTGGSSAEALEAVGRVIGSTTIAALRGEAVPNAVNLPAASLEAPALKLLTSVSAAAGLLLSVLMPEGATSMSVQAQGLVSNDLTEHVTNAALASALQGWLGRRVTPVNGRLIAEEMGMTVRTSADDGDETSIPRFEFEISGDEESHSVVVSWDRDIAGIVEVDRFGLSQPLSGYVLITHHQDRPGVIGSLATTLARYNINIAGMQVSRVQPRGEAMMVTNVDELIPEEALAEIRVIDGLENAFIVSLPHVLSEQDAVHTASIVSPGYRGK